MQHLAPFFLTQSAAKSVLGAVPVGQSIMESLFPLISETVNPFSVAVASADLDQAFSAKSAKAARECFYCNCVIARELTLRDLACFIDGVQSNELRRFEFSWRQDEVIQLGDRAAGRSQCGAG